MTSISILKIKMQNKTNKQNQIKLKVSRKEKPRKDQRMQEKREKQYRKKSIKQNVELLRGLIKSINF